MREVVVLRNNFVACGVRVSANCNMFVVVAELFTKNHYTSCHGRREFPDTKIKNRKPKTILVPLAP